LGSFCSSLSFALLASCLGFGLPGKTELQGFQSSYCELSSRGCPFGYIYVSITQNELLFALITTNHNDDTLYRTKLTLFEICDRIPLVGKDCNAKQMLISSFTDGLAYRVLIGGIDAVSSQLSGTIGYRFERQKIKQTRKL